MKGEQNMAANPPEQPSLAQAQLEPESSLRMSRKLLRTARRRQAGLAPDTAAVAAIAAAADDILLHGRRDHPDALQAVARQAGGRGIMADGGS